MELLIGIVVVGVVLFGFGAKADHNMAKDAPNFASRDVRTAQAHDRSNLLNAYRREIANLLVWRDLTAILSSIGRSTPRCQPTRTGSWRPSRQSTMSWPRSIRSTRDFDGFGTRLHVLHADGRTEHWSDDLASRFADITRFQAIACATYWKTDAVWFGGATRDDDLAHLTEYVATIKDTKFALRLERAVDDYRVWCEGKGGHPHWDSPIEEHTFDNYNFVVRPIESFEDNRYGVHFKDTNEYGIYGSYVFEDRPRVMHSYYRSDAAFQNERLLDILHSVADAYRESLRPPRDEESGDA